MSVNLRVDEPMPFDRAVERMRSRVPVGSRLSSEEWDTVPMALSDRAFFSSTVDDIDLLAEMRSRIDDALSLPTDRAFQDRSSFTVAMRERLGAAPGDNRALTDITSQRRLELIYDMNVEEAYEYGRHQAGQDPALLDAFPARELIRVAARNEPRPWENIWQAAGGRLYGGRMIARRDDEVWVNISRFGRPYPPFDFGSGMGIQDIERDEAIELGVIWEEEQVAGNPKAYNENLSQGAQNVWKDSALREQLEDTFGDQVFFDRGRPVWAGSKIDDLVDAALRGGPESGGNFRFGKSSQSLISKAPEEIVNELSGKQLNVTQSNIWHAFDRHGQPDMTRPGSGEIRGDQLPLNRSDIRAVNSAFMDPDNVSVDRSGIRIEKDTFSGVLEIIFVSVGNTLQPTSIRKKKKGLQPPDA
ncbi:MAG: hypothetical protein JJT75_15120 [Opitutales bacterium]|nr:hypothetical protein [Opitutales bacterium]